MEKSTPKMGAFFYCQETAIKREKRNASLPFYTLSKILLDQYEKLIDMPP